jgi:hypothetical protein
MYRSSLRHGARRAVVKPDRGIVLKRTSVKTLLRNFVIEIVVYAALVLGYFLLVLRVLGKPLDTLATRSLVLYAFAALGLIVVQAVVLEVVTSFLVDRLGLDRLE